MSPAALAQAQLDAYNARDLDAFVGCYADDVQVYGFPGALQFQGRAAFRARYAERFATPGLHAEVKHRVVLGDRVVDHELAWVDGPDAAPKELVVIYSVADGRIARVDFVR